MKNKQSLQFADTKSEKSRKGSKQGAEEFETRIKELEDQLLRAVADYRNLEKRWDEERRELIKYANQELFERLLPSFDTLFLAARHTQDQGVQLTIKMLLDTFAELGINKIRTEGEEFNPELMEATEMVDGEEGKVIEEVRPGFTLYNKLLKPAHVKVGKRADS